ncbi:MAG: cytochrome-c oxidase [Aquabacterium sp.]|nr:cytochrome-c oxidase [Aquabacterium sp.]
MAKNLMRCAVLYALLGIGMGIVMAASGDFTNKGVHVHINLVGWVSMGIMAMAYEVFPSMAGSVLARLQFWLHNLGLPLMAGGIYAVMHHLPMAEPIVGSGSVIVALAFVAFAINVWRHAGRTTVVTAARHQQAVELAAA